jgi:hypothetical protein
MESAEFKEIQFFWKCCAAMFRVTLGIAASY